MCDPPPPPQVREGARRQSAGELLTCLELMVLWGVALALSATSFETASANALASDMAATLMWVGNLWCICKPGLRTIAELALPGALPLERTTVCPNSGFTLHRNNEFMFLMLGETLLQIVVAIDPGSVGSEGEEYAVLTAAGGFIVAVCMMSSFRAMVRGQLDNYQRTNTGLAAQAAETEHLLMMTNQMVSTPPPPPPGAVSPADSTLFGGGGPSNRGGNGGGPKSSPDGTPGVETPPGQRRNQIGGRGRGGTGHRSSVLKKMIDTKALDVRFEAKAVRILRHMRLYNVLNTLLWEFKALTVMLTGVGVKLAMYKPRASPTAHFARAQRLELGIPIAGVFAIQLFHTIFVKNRHHYSLRTMREHPVHVLVVTSRIVLIAAYPLVGAFFELEPWSLLLVYAAMCVAQVTLLQIHDFKANIHSNNQHPMREMPNALQSLQQKRKRAAETADMKKQAQLLSKTRASGSEAGAKTAQQPRDGSPQTPTPRRNVGHTSDRSHHRSSRADISADLAGVKV